VSNLENGKDVGQEKKTSNEKKSGKKFYYRNKKNRYYKNKPKGEKKSSVSSFKKISIVVPLLNEAESLRPLYVSLQQTIKENSYLCEIIFVDDGSTDNSLSIIRDICRENKHVKYISFKKNYGKAAALQLGFKAATGDAIITMDADLQDDPAEIPNLLKKLETVDLVSGWKKKRYDPFIKRITSKFYNRVTSIFTGVKLHDMNCGLKAYKSEVVQNLHLYGELHRFIPVLADWQGFSVGEAIVKHHPRRYGKTKYGISRFFKGFVDLITVVFTPRYIKRPMHLFGFIGALSFFLGICVNIYLSYEWYFHNKALSNRPMLLLGVLLIIVGIQFFAVGLLGEILVHNFQDDKEYIIKDKN
jgi:glycosyltransferase involved in cell wall biosynthesis